MISPNARMMTCPPRMNRSYGTTKSMMIRANDLDSNMTVRCVCAVRSLVCVPGSPQDDTEHALNGSCHGCHP